ncbi:hypothetical protein ACFWAY_49435 [Rhodococcus sp. NPDC059968]|uniref:hypothetical protein n=1 Tax=Rhodococcus sp. NPDC059968 TaxID=3347017 RepID=UPI0036707B8B
MLTKPPQLRARGEQHSVTEITTPRPSEVTARCHGSADTLAVDIAAPHGWNIHARHGSQTLTLTNPDQVLATVDVDTTNQNLDTCTRWTGPHRPG